MEIKTVAVLGASGTVGALTGGLLAQNGVRVYFLSRAEERSRRGLEKAMRQARSEVIAKNVICGDYEGLLEEAVSTADWVLEAVAEDFDVKRELYEQVEVLRRPTTFVSSTTSSLPLTHLAEGRTEAFRRNFLATHFYNPPGRMLACEICGHADTDPELVARVAGYLTDTLNREVIAVKNIPAFAGNRIAFMLFAKLTSLVEEYGVELIDYLVGPYTGRLMPPLATLDLVGLDIHKAIVQSLQSHTHDAMGGWLVVPPYLDSMIERGLLGNKRKAGFYRKQENGQYIFFDPKTGDYIPGIQPHFAFVENAKHFVHMGMYAKAFETILEAEGREAAVVTDILCAYVAYAYSLIGEVTPAEDGIHGIDRVMSSGFNWVPPSVVLQMLGGCESILPLIEAKGLPVPASLDDPEKTVCDVLAAAKCFVAT